MCEKLKPSDILDIRIILRALLILVLVLVRPVLDVSVPLCTDVRVADPLPTGTHADQMF